MRQEANDGYDAIEWAARQPWSTGKVGTFSGSYVGLTQWQPAIQTPPSLAAISPNITASDYHDHWTYVNGAFALWFAQSWIPLTMGKETLLRQLLASGQSREQANAEVAAFTERSNRELTSNWVWQLPLKSFPEFRSIAPYYYEWLDHPNYDAYWQALDVEPRYQNVRVPTLNSGAWYDIFQVGTVRNFQGMRTRGGTAEARQGSKLIMTCCGHAGTSGQVSWGTASPPVTTELRFFDRYLKGLNNGVEQDPAVQLYVLNPPDTGTQGSGFWVNADQYPLPGTRNTSYYFTSTGRANSSAGDGKLDRTPPWADPDADKGKRRLLEELRASIPDQFVYHPNNPVPTVGETCAASHNFWPLAPTTRRASRPAMMSSSTRASLWPTTSQSSGRSRSCCGLLRRRATLTSRRSWWMYTSMALPTTCSIAWYGRASAKDRRRLPA